MTEDDYVLATNLAKIRIAERAIRDMLFVDQPAFEREWISVLEQTGELRAKLEVEIEMASER